VLGLMPVPAALGAVGKGLDVYLFLVGMMLLSEVAREHGLFDWVAATAAIRARGSSPRLFVLVYATGIVTTTFLSNDATAVVLTPAVYAAARKAKADPLPLLFACALIANAASFVLPISNPANLVLYGGTMPPLGQWFASFALPSVAARARRSPLVPFRSVSWSVLPLVAGLFVLVEAVTSTGLTAHLAGLLRSASADPVRGAALAGTALAFGANAINNLPAGLIASIAVAQAEPARIVTDALLIGVDLGPNLSITGSLATILWLQAIRREGEDVGFLQFLKVGTVTMVPALFAALATRLWLG